MRSQGQVHHLIASLNPSYTIRPCAWTGNPGWENADAEAYAFIVGSVLKFPASVLQLMAQHLSPPAMGYLLWGAAEMKRATRYSVNMKIAKWPSADERAELARYADDGAPLCDDNC